MHPGRSSGNAARWSRLFLAGCVVLGSHMAVAQTPPAAGQAPNAGQILEQSRQPQTIPVPDAIKPSGVTNNVPEFIRPKVTASGAKVRPTAFRFEGNTVFSSPVLANALQGDLGKELDFDGLSDVVDKVKAYYRNRGYFLTIAYLPRQVIENGVVTIAVLEGRIGQVRVKTPVPPEARVTEAHVMSVIHGHVKPGDIITENHIERPLLLLRDLPGVDVKSTINPGQEIGTADLDIEIVAPEHAKRVSGSVSLDNSGDRYTGADRLNVTANFASPTGHGDMLAFRGYLTQVSSNTFGQLNYLVPIGAYGTRIGVDLERLDYKLGKEFSGLNADGYADVYQLFAVHPLFRNKEYNVFLQAGFDGRKFQDRSAGQTSDRKVSGAKFQVNGDWRERGAVSIFSLETSFSRLSIDDAAISNYQVANGNAAGSFEKTNFELRRLQQLVPGLALQGSLSGQVASKVLDPAEKFVLGGPNGVRGYPVGDRAGDEGFIASAELRYTIPHLRLGPAGVVASVFYDYGHVRFHHDLGNAPLFARTAANTDSVHDVGFGLNAGAENKFLLRASVAVRGSQLPEDSHEQSRTRYWLEAIKWF